MLHLRVKSSLCNDNVVSVKNDKITIWFEYYPDLRNRKQDEINRESFISIQKQLNNKTSALFKHVLRSNGEEWTLLEKQLNNWTKKNTFDYFIHKDLGGFLRRELDFFIKNEVLHLDDIIDSKSEDLGKRLIKLKVLKKVGDKIINFLTQIEEFQKKLWLKKKFIVQTDYCLTLDRVPQIFYAEIAKNEKQCKEWVKLFAIDEIKGGVKGQVAYSKPLTPAFLRANPYLVLDTALFEDEFKYCLLAKMDNIDEQTDGLLVRSENFQALNLLEKKYKDSVKCIYIDPPYNTSAAPIIYKNSYKHSTWMSLIKDRVSLSAEFQIPNESILAISIDENESNRLGLELDTLFPSHTKTQVSIVHNPRGRRGNAFAICHDFIYFIFPKGLMLPKRKLKEPKAKPLMKTGSESARSTAKNCFYPIIINQAGKLVKIGDVPSEDYHPKSSQVEKADGTIELWPLCSKKRERKWRYIPDSLKRHSENLLIRKSLTNRWAVYLSKYEESYKTVWSDAVYNAAEYGSTLLKRMMMDGDFSFPKSYYTIKDVITIGIGGKHGIVLDYFAGSGTTGHAVIDLNRKDGGSRKYILVEMGEYFDNVLKPRIQKAIYSEDWKEGKPLYHGKGYSHCFKTIYLESYEDSLNNLKLECPKERKEVLKLSSDSDLGEQYLLSYMLDMETRDSIFNLEMFEKPFDYELIITRNNEPKRQKIDLVETFNYLIGLYVEKMSFIDGIMMIQGTTRKGESILVLWRNMDAINNETLNKWFKKYAKDIMFDQLYVNGDNNLESAILIEQVFHSLIFA